MNKIINEIIKNNCETRPTKKIKKRKSSLKQSCEVKLET